MPSSRVALLLVSLLLVVPGLSACGLDETVTKPAAAHVPTVHERVEAAVQRSAADDQPVLLVLAGDNPASTKLLALLRRPAVARAVAADYHLVRVDAGTKAGAAEATARGVRLARTGVPAVAVLLDGQAVYDGSDRQFAHPARLGTGQVVRWLQRWS